ncbi:MAG TPA: LLM class flavin-dependent oxidoreductase [Acidimicrobiia bacterium]|nr:LLM class flavin-dependent oxidoreductase [Acidimicrobiia bacterium]
MDEIPDPALVVLVGPSGSGKSNWAEQRYRPEEIVSSDRLRALVGSGEHDLDASEVAFDILDRIVASRVGRRLTAVVDTLGFDAPRRRAHLAAASKAGLAAVAVVFETAEGLCRARNRNRSRPVPAAALTGQFRRLREARAQLEDEGWDLIVRIRGADDQASVPAPAPASEPSKPTVLDLYLQISRFPDKEPLGPWLSQMAATAQSVGFRGLALMDHLVQIPQVGREWDNIVEAYTGLAFMAASTSMLQLGTLVTGVTLRNPALLAKMLASLDALSGGRAFCGLGAGWFKAEQAAYGYPALDTRTRLQSLEDTIQILRLMWAPGKATYTGQIHSVREAICYPRPLHYIPIYVGGKGKRTVSLASRLADGLNIVGAAHLDEVLPVVKRRFDDQSGFQLSILDTPLVGCDRSEVASKVEQWRGRTRAEIFASRHHAGVPERHLQRYRDLASRGVGAIFVSPVGLIDDGELEQWRSITEALRAPERP